MLACSTNIFEFADCYSIPNAADLSPSSYLWGAVKPDPADIWAPEHTIATQSYLHSGNLSCSAFSTPEKRSSKAEALSSEPRLARTLRSTPGKALGTRKAALIDKFAPRQRKLSDEDGYDTATTVGSSHEEDISKFALLERREVHDVVAEVEEHSDDEGQEGPDATIRKPKRKFTDQQERERFVRSYKMKYKTELCRNWEIYRQCKFGESCAFAHGESELNRKQHVPTNYKTRPCRQFHEEMFCPYGVRCQFLHSGKIAPGRELSYSEVLAENSALMEKRAFACGKTLEDMQPVSLFKKPRLSVFKALAKKNQKKKRSGPHRGEESASARM